MVVIVLYYQGSSLSSWATEAFELFAWRVAGMCLAQGVLDNLISYWWRCVSSCCWSWYCWLPPEAICAPYPTTLPRTLWQPLSLPVHLLCSSTTQKGKTIHICSETCFYSYTFSLCNSTKGWMDNIANSVWWDGPVSPALATGCGHFSCASPAPQMIISFHH